MACEGGLRGPGRAARSSSLRVADMRSSGAQLCAQLRSGLQLRSDTAAHRRRGIIHRCRHQSPPLEPSSSSKRGPSCVWPGSARWPLPALAGIYWPGRRNHADCYSPADEAGYSWSGSGWSTWTRSGPLVCLWDIVHLNHQRRRQAGSRHERVHQLLRLPRTAGQHLQEQTDPALPLRAAAIRQDRRQLLLQAALEHLKRRYFRVE